ncbi:MAG TPA: efflux RND transporter permease subunit [Kofleriaceae bacterium]|jgi:multidrug efflux pump subunit AcrB
MTMRWIGLALLAACHDAPKPTLVQIDVSASGNALDVERTAVRPIEVALAGAPGLRHIRSAIGPDHAVIDVELSTEPLAARADLVTRLEAAALPTSVTAELAPMTSPDGVVLRFAMSSERMTLVEVGEQYEQLRRALLTVPGVADVSACGVLHPQVHVTIDAHVLAGYGIGLDAITDAIGRATVRGQPTRASTLRSILVTTKDGAPILLRDLARIADDATPSECLAVDETGARVLDGAVWVRAGSGRDEVRTAAEAAISAARTQLPVDVKVVTLPDAPLVRIAVPPDPGPSGESLRRIATALHAPVERGRPEGGLAVERADIARARLDGAPPPVPGAKLLASTAPWLAIRGDNLDQLDAIAEQLTTGLAVDERSDVPRAPEVTYDIDRRAAADHDIDAAPIAQALAARVGIDVTPDIRIQLQGELDEITLPRPDGARIPLSALVSSQEQLVPQAISHIDGQRVLRLRVADPDALRARLETFRPPPGYTVAFE